MPSLALVDAQSVKLAPRLGQQRGLDAHKRVDGCKRQVRCDTDYQRLPASHAAWPPTAIGRRRGSQPARPTRT